MDNTQLKQQTIDELDRIIPNWHLDYSTDNPWLEHRRNTYEYKCAVLKHHMPLVIAVQTAMKNIQAK